MGDGICTACGHRNEPGANFCSSCGAPLEVAAEEPTATHRIDPAELGLAEPPLEHRSDVAVFVVDEGPKSGSRYAIDTDVIRVGRHPDSDIFLDDITVSRRHAEVRSGADGTRVVDVGSLNGTYVNRHLVESATLSDHDVVQIGKFKLVYLVGEES